MDSKKTQINLYVSPDLGDRMDQLIRAYNEDTMIGSIHSRGELLEVLISKMERYLEKNGEVKSFLQ